MTIATSTYFTDWYVTDGANKNWAFDFVIQKASDVYIEVRDEATQVVTQFTNGFEVLWNNEEFTSGYVVYPASGSALAAGKSVRAIRDVPYTQTTEIGLEGAFNPEIHERAFDRLTMQTQQLNGQMARALKVDIGVTPPDISDLIDMIDDGIAASIIAVAAKDATLAAAAGVQYPVSYAAQALTTSQQTQARHNIGLGRYVTLAALQATTVPAAIKTVYLEERTVGYGGGAYWAYEASEPNVPALAKTQDAAGKWFRLLPGKYGYDPKALGARTSYVIDSDTRAVYDELAAKPTPLLLRAMDDVVERLKSFNLWDKISHLYLGGASDNLADFLVDWKNPTTSAAVVTGSITYEANRGPKGTGGWVNLGYTSATIGSQNDVHAGVWVEDGTGTGNILLGHTGATAIFGINPRTSGGSAGVRLNNSTIVSEAVPRREGYTVASRLNGTEVRLTKDGNSLSVEASVSETPATGPISLFANPSGGTLQDDRVIALHFGVGLTDDEAKWVYRIIRDFRDAAQSCALFGEPVTPDQIYDVPFDSQPAFQAAIDLGSVMVHHSGMSGSHYWLGNQIEVPSYRSFVCDSWSVKFKLKADAPESACCITNAEWVLGNSHIKIKGGWWDANRGRRTAGEQRPGDACIALAHVRHFGVEGNYCKSGALHAINVSSTDETRLGNTDWKDGTPGSSADSASWFGSITNNHVTDCDDDGITLHWTNHVNVSFNKCWEMTSIHSTGSGGIECDDGNRWTTIHGNSIWDCDVNNGFGIASKGHDTTPANQNVSITGNLIQRCSRGISVNAAEAAVSVSNGHTITSNVLEDLDQYGIYVAAEQNYVVSNNVIKRTGKSITENDGGAIRISGGSLLSINGSILGNTIDDTCQCNYAILFVNAVHQRVTVSNNTMQNVLGGIRLIIPNAIVNGNVIYGGTPSGGGTPATGIAASSVTTLNCIITSNHVTGFTTPIATLDASNVKADNIEVAL